MNSRLLTVPSTAFYRTWLLAAFVLPSLVASADTVTLTAGNDQTATVEIIGDIVDYTGNQIAIRRPSGERTYPAERVLRIETSWPEGFQAGRDAMAQGDYANATKLITNAARAEQRAWVRRMAMQDLIECYVAAGNRATAGQLLIDLSRSDPTTSAIAHAPLAWIEADGVPPATFEAWLTDSSSVVAQLLGASYALSTGRRNEAIAVLKKLERDPDTRIAFLARSQNWRPQVITANTSDLARWAKLTREAPESAQSGAWTVVGDLHRRFKQLDEAALCYLRAELLADRQPQLAAGTIWQAARTLKADGQQQESARLVDELLAKYPQTAAAGEARAMVQSYVN